jgi:hypothetical protein
MHNNVIILLMVIWIIDVSVANEMKIVVQCLFGELLCLLLLLFCWLFSIVYVFNPFY